MAETASTGLTPAKLDEGALAPPLAATPESAAQQGQIAPPGGHPPVVGAEFTGDAPEKNTTTAESILGERPEQVDHAEDILGARPPVIRSVVPGALWTGPDADAFYSKAEPIGNVLRAVGQGAEEAWENGKNLGFSDDINEFMKKAGIYNDVAKGQGNWLKTYNEAMMRPAINALFGIPGAAFRGVGAVFTGGFRGLGQVATEAGQPILGRDITAIPEAFPAFGAEIGVPAIEHGMAHPFAAVGDLARGARVAAMSARDIAAGAAMRFGPLTLPEVGAAARYGVIGPWGAKGWDGTAEYPTEHMPVGSSIGFGQLGLDATQDAIPAQFNVGAPADIHEAARRMAPDVFEQYDAAADQQDALRARIAAEQADLRRNAEGQAPGAQEINDLQARMETAPPRLQKKYQARINALQGAHEDFLGDEFTMGALTRDTESITAARQEMQELDYRMRDLAPQVSQAYRDAAERYPETQPREEQSPEEPEGAAPQPEIAAEEPGEQAPREQPASGVPTAPTAATPTFDIASDVSSKLQAAGVPKEQADANGALWKAYYTTRAGRFRGARGTPEEFYRSEAQDIRGFEKPPPAAPRTGLRSIAQIQAEEKVGARRAKAIYEAEVVALAERQRAARAAPAQPAPAAAPPVRQPEPAMAGAGEQAAPGAEPNLTSLPENLIDVTSSQLDDALQRMSDDATEVRFTGTPAEIKALQDAGLTISDNGMIPYRDARLLVQERMRRIGEKSAPAEQPAGPRTSSTGLVTLRGLLARSEAADKEFPESGPSRKTQELRAQVAKLESNLAGEATTARPPEAPAPTAETTPGVATTAEQAALQAAIARARPVSAEEVAARRARARNPVVEKLAETVGAKVPDDATPAEVMDDIVDRLPVEQVRQEIAAEAEAGTTAYEEAEKQAKEAVPDFNPDEVYGGDQGRSQEELENEHREPTAEAPATEQRPGGGGEPEPTRASEGPVREGGEPPPGVGGAGGRPTEAAGEPGGPEAPGEAAEQPGPVEPRGGEPAGAAAEPRTEAPVERPKDDRGNPIFRKGERVVTPEGRHGEVASADGITMAPIFGGPGRTTYHYTVKTDAGAVTHPIGALTEETGEAPKVVPDVRYHGSIYEPEAMQRIIAGQENEANRYDRMAKRARTAKSRNQHTADANIARQAGQEARVVLDEWKAQNPEEAQRIFGVPAAAEEAKAPEAAKPETAGGMSIIETVHTRDKYPLYVVQGGDRVAPEQFAEMRRSAKQGGAHWSSFRGQGAVTGWQFKTRADAEAFMEEWGGEKTTDTDTVPTNADTAATQAPEWREVGKNQDGETVYANADGAHSVVENGARVIEPVEVRPVRNERGGVSYVPSISAVGSKDRRFEVAPERAEEPTTTAEVTEQAGQPEEQSALWQNQQRVSGHIQDIVDTYRRDPRAAGELIRNLIEGEWKAAPPDEFDRLLDRVQKALKNSTEARTIADAVAPAEGKGPLPISTEPERDADLDAMFGGSNRRADDIKDVVDAFKRGGAREANEVFKSILAARKLPFVEQNAIVRDAQAAMREAGWKGGTEEGPPEATPPTQAARSEGEARPENYGANNKLVTREDADAIRARLRAKRGELRSGIDPEMMLDGARLAVFHIEAGTRAFADYAREMVADLGDEFRPYLRSWYESARHWPGVDARGLSDAAEIDAETARWAEAREAEAAPAEPDARNGEELFEAHKGDPILEEIAQQVANGRTPEEIASEPGVRFSAAEVADLTHALEERGMIPEPEEGPDAGTGLQLPGAIRPGDEGTGAPDVQRTEALGPDGQVPEGEGSGGRADDAGTAGEQAPDGERELSDIGSEAGPGGDDGAFPGLPEADIPAATGTTGRYSDRPDAGVTGKNFTIEPGGVAEGRGRIAKARGNIQAIEIAKLLTEEDRPATKAEQDILSKYVGWGGLKGAFRDSAGKFGKGLEAIGERLEKILTPEEHATAARSTQYAHYTAEHVIRSMWDGVRRMGFEGGSVFEPGMGIGHFLGMMPPDLAEKSQYQGIEMDHLTGTIAKLLYPESGIRTADFTRTPVPEGTFDLVIGNPPFSDVVIKSDPKYSARNFMLHDYFFAKSLDSVRPGGLLAFVTSAGTMNKLDAAAREYLAERAEFVGGIRLPSSAFRQNAGTDVTTDVLFFKRRPEGRVDLREEKPDWTQTVQREMPNAAGETTAGNVSRYFSEHPENVLGREGFFDKLYKDRYAVHQEPGTDLPGDFQAAVQRLPENIMDPPLSPEETAKLDFTSTERKDGSFYIGPDGELMQYRSGAGTSVARRGPGVKGGFTAGERERIEHLVPMRDALRDVFAADLAEDTERGAEARARLNEHYDRFVDKFGPINKTELSYHKPTAAQIEEARLEAREEARFIGDPWDEGDFDPSDMIAAKKSLTEIARARQDARERIEASGAKFREGSFDPSEVPESVRERLPNIRAFSSDPESYRLRSIERYDASSGEHSKKDIFTKSILTREREPEIRSANDGVLWSMNKFGRFDVDKIAAQMGRDRDSIIQELGDSVYKVPGTDGTYQTKDEYLSGDIVTKLEEAKQAAESDPEVRRNIPALEAATPPPLAPSRIDMLIGMPWIPNEHVVNFISDRLELPAPRVTHSDFTGTWQVLPPSKEISEARERWSTPDRDAYELLADAMNRTPPRIYKWEGSGRDRKRVFDEAATQAAVDKINDIAGTSKDGIRVPGEFDKWLAANPDVQDELAQKYNDELNRSVLRQFDGSYLTTPGVAEGFSWRPHQTSGVARIIAQGNTYVAHAVGAGKTSLGIGAIMEQRRLGLIRKPLVVVPNHMLGQWAKEWYEQYPTAKLAIADEDRFHTSRRKQFVANVAQDDLDGIIMTEASFVKIPISDEFQRHLIEEQLEQFDQSMSELDPEADRIAVGRLQNQREKLEQKLSKKPEGKDETLTFEQMGIDHITVDEAHGFRKLSYATKQTGLKGLSPEGSEKAWDLYTKMRYLDGQKPGRSAVFLSGTPITNTMGELFSVSRFMQPQALAKRGLSHFDSWAQTFGTTKTGLEGTASGGLQPVTRFADFVNAPELYKMVGEVMDIVTPQQLEEYVVRPKIAGGERQQHLAPQTEAVKAYQEKLAARMDAIKARKGPPAKGQDIMLSVINDGRHVAIDPRFVEQAQNDPDSKLNMMIRNVAKIYHETADTQFYDPATNYEKPSFRGPATQMVFANMGVNGRGPMGFSSYQAMKEGLRRLGVEPDHVAFIGDYQGTLRRQALFNDMNEGKVRVLIGSTQKMGTGVNAQRRLIAIHNEDPLWYPADDEQRIGRGLRQGNHNPEIQIHDYSTKGTYDSSMWGMMGRKARFIERFFRGDPELRRIEDIGEASTYEQASAMTISDPRIITLTNLKQDLGLAIRREEAHDQEQWSLRSKHGQKVKDADYYAKQADSIGQDIARREDTRGDAFKMNVVGEDFTKRKDAAAALDAAIDDRGAGLGNGASTTIGRIGGFPIVMSRYKGGFLSYGLRMGNGREFDINGADGSGLIASAEARLRRMEEDQQYAQQNGAKAARDAEAIRPLLGKQFDGGGEINRLAKAVRDLEAQISGKDQEAAGLSSDEPPDVAAGEQEAADQTRKLDLEQPGAIQTPETPGRQVDLGEDRTLYQKAKGMIRLGAGKARAVITLMERADASTFIHETGHAWLEDLMADAKHEAAPEDLIQDAATVRRWLGAEPDAPITTRQHEKFARGFERYMMEGVAPNRGLARVFQQFKQWLTGIYRTVTQLRAPITDDIRRVFDRMLGTEERTVIAPDRPEEPQRVPEPEEGAKVASDLADLHEADAQHTPAEEAGQAADQVRAERDRTTSTYAPEVADELAGRRPGEEARGGGEPPEGAARNGRGARPKRREGGNAPPSGEERGGGGDTEAEGAPAPGEPAERPSSPYTPVEEPSRVVDKAGNIRLDNLNSPEDVKQALRDLAAQNDDFIVTRGGTISDVQRREMADALGLRVDNFDAQKPDGVSPSVWAEAVQKLTFQAADEAAQAARAFGEGGSPEAGAQYLLAKQRLLMVADHFAGVTAEAGRTLRVFNKADMAFVGDLVATMERDTGRTLYQMQQEAKAVAAMDTTAQRSKMLQDTRNLTKGQIIKRGFLSYFINNLISGPITHTSYSVGNAVWSLFKATALTATEATFDAAGLAFGGDASDRVYYGEVGAQIYGMFNGAKDGIVPGWTAFKSGISHMEGAEKLAALAGRRGAIDGTSPMGEAALRNNAIAPALKAVGMSGKVAEPLGYALETPSRAVSAIHTLFYSMNYEREIARRAFRQAANEGLMGQDFSTRVAELTQDPPASMIEAAHKEALDAVLMKRPDYGSTQYHFARAINQSLPLKLLMPFLQIGVNILDEGLIRSTPLGLARQEVRDNLAGRNGEVARSQQYARIMVGSGVMAGVMGLTGQGIMTGGGPGDSKERALKEAQGWKPYSFRVGNMYVPYRKYLGPLGPLVGAAANIHEVGEFISEGELGKAVGSAVLGFSEVVANETWMSGLSNFIDAMRHWDRNGEKYVRNLALDFIPFSVGMGQSARLIDQYQREVHSWTDALRNKIPGLSQGLYPQRDWTGTPIASSLMVSPSQARPDPTMEAMEKAEYFPAKLPREIRGVPLTGQQYDDLVRVEGHLLKLRLDQLVATPGFTNMPEGYQQRAMSQVRDAPITGTKKVAEDWVMFQLGNENIMRQAMAAKAAQMQGQTKQQQQQVKRQPATSP